MDRRGHDRRAVVIAILGLALVTVLAVPMEVRGEAGQTAYSEWVRLSRYITARDGTRLAADIFHPASGGKPVEEPLPVIWTHHRYHRSEYRSGRLYTVLDQFPWLVTMLQHGYVVAAVDARGSGASFGTRRGEFTPEEAHDAYDVTEWLAAQPWCTGKIGMYGRSYMGITQYMAAATAPPHLLAIFPEMAMFDLYETAYPGGVLRSGFVNGWGLLTRQKDTSLAAPVDEDRDQTLAAKAVAEHKGNISVAQVAAALPCRDSKEQNTGALPYFEWSPGTYLAEVKKSGVAIYILSGWYDLWPRDSLVWFCSLDNPRKIVIGPWAHGQTSGLDLAVEHLRWYDYWLKGIKNGVMDEPPILYYTMGAIQGETWRTARQWPPPEAKLANYYFAAGPAGSAKSRNDGLLRAEPPVATAASDDYTVNYIASSGAATRWAAGYAGPFGYTDMAANDAVGLTYTTPPLTGDVEVTGHPVMHLWVTTSARDGDFFAYLEEVDERGYAYYITEGVLRVSRRQTVAPPFNYLGLPYHRGLLADVSETPPGAPVELVFDLLPTSNLFDKGHRLRITVTCADRGNAATPEISPAPLVKIYRDAGHPSHIVLPIVSRAAAAH